MNNEKLQHLDALDFPDIREDHFGNDHAIYPTERNMRVLVDHYNQLVNTINNLIVMHDKLKADVSQLYNRFYSYEPREL